jgi:hypothetical protein
MYTGGWYFCGPWRNVLIIVFLYHFNWKNPSDFASTWTITHRLWMYVSAWPSIVRACICYQQSSMYTGWWYFCGCRWILSKFVFLQHSMCKIQSDFASTWTITHRLWMYVSAWLFILKSLKWDQQSSIYTGWSNFCGCRWILSIFVFLQHSMWKILSNFVSAWTGTHRLWMYVFRWLFIVRSLKWDQQSSMHTG